jgi:hypothetical protein
MASFTCPAGAICSDQARTFVGATTRTVQRVVPGTQGSTKPVTETTGGTGIYHRTTTTVKQDGAGNISGGETVVYIIKNGSWQPAAITKDGGKTYSFSDPNYPTMDGVAGVGLQKELQNPNGAIHKNVDKNVSDALKKAGITKPQDKAKIVDSSKGNGADGATDTGDTSQPAEPPETGSAASAGTKTSGFGNFIYPEDLGSTKQDIIKFTMLEYKPSGLGRIGSSGGENTLSLGGNRDANRKGVGTVILPIPSGISDTNSADWGGKDLNALDAALAAGAYAGITEGFGAGLKSLAESAQTAVEDPGTKKAFGSYFTAAAMGGDQAQILARAEGTVINPNMELLFNGPQLRPFSFAFKMSARNSNEAKQIIGILNFFKRGMSPIKSESNLFLKSPNTFRIQYINRLSGQDKDHPYIGKIKECALQSFTVNYTPEGQYATFRDGVLVSYEIQMQFQELEPVFNSDYEGLEGIGY